MAPSEWTNYVVSREAICIFSSTQPVSLFKRMDDQSYRINRPTLTLKFFENGLTKMCSQIFSNKAARSLGRLNFDWYYTVLSKDRLRVLLKQSLFKYPSSAVPFSNIAEWHPRMRTARTGEGELYRMKNRKPKEKWLPN